MKIIANTLNMKKFYIFDWHAIKYEINSKILKFKFGQVNFKKQCHYSGLVPD